MTADRARHRRGGQGVSAVFHLAAQVAVTTSMQDPREDFAVNLLGTMNLLETLGRNRSGPPPAIFPSTNKVYGNLDVRASVMGNAAGRAIPHSPSMA